MHHRLPKAISSNLVNFKNYGAEIISEIRIEFYTSVSLICSIKSLIITGL
jgi:hypothetical protein